MILFILGIRLELIKQLPARGIDKCLHRVRVEGYAALFKKIQRVGILRFLVDQPGTFSFFGSLNREFYPADEFLLVTLRDLRREQLLDLRDQENRDQGENQLHRQLQNRRYIHLVHVR